MITLKKSLTIQLIAMLSLLVLSLHLFAAPKADLWTRWQISNPQSQTVIDHAVFQQFLNRYVVSDASSMNLVQYANVTPQDKQALKQYLDSLSRINIDNYNPNEQLAYWINLYNALTIWVVLQHYPVKSILDINLSGLFTRGPWGAKLISVEHIPLSLNDIEHRIIRPIWHDARTHYALNCASYGCPNLNKQVYTGAAIHTMLTKAAITYINSPRGVLIQGNTLTVSQIYEWYQSDFGGNPQAVIHHVMLYANPNLKKQLTTFQTISGYQYDWRLNNAGAQS